MMFDFDWSKRTHKGLRKWIMYMVKNQPRTGMEIMDMIENTAQGWWRPSPGSIYPLLDQMVTEGVLRKLEGKKYSLTERGLEEIDKPFSWMGPSYSPRSPEEVAEVISSYVSYLEDVAGSDRRKLLGSTGKIKELSSRLAKLGEST
jgi:DNA-binding PadR family transcriptional regulator